MSWEEQMLRIGEAASLLGVCCDTLRRWEREGRIEPELRTLGGQRRYTVKQVVGLRKNADGVLGPLLKAEIEMSWAHSFWQSSPLSKEKEGYELWKAAADRFTALRRTVARNG